jgi:hypothetical protein
MFLQKTLGVLSLILNWVGLMRDLLEKHFDEKPNLLQSVRPKCFTGLLQARN